MTVSAIPEGCNSVNVYLVVKNAQEAIDFYAKAFHGTSTCCMKAPDGSVMHGEIKIGNSTVMICQENPEWKIYAVDPGDMRTKMHQDAFPGEDISDRPKPEKVAVPAILKLIESDKQSGRYAAKEILKAQLV